MRSVTFSPREHSLEECIARIPRHTKFELNEDPNTLAVGMYSILRIY